MTFVSLVMSIFRNKTCILYHLAFLVQLPTHYFLPQITRIYPLKTYFLTTISPFWAMFLVVLKDFIYTKAADIYAFRLAFSIILHCVQHQNASHLAPKRTAFSSILHCVQRHIALHLAAKCTAFSSKQPNNWCKCRFF